MMFVATPQNVPFYIQDFWWLLQKLEVVWKYGHNYIISHEAKRRYLGNVWLRGEQDEEESSLLAG